MESRCLRVDVRCASTRRLERLVGLPARNMERIKPWQFRRAAPTLTAVAIFLLLALVLTWPLPLHLATHAPGDGSDDPAILWNLWWVRFSLTELRQSPFESAWMFYPLGVNLVFYTLTTLN